MRADGRTQTQTVIHTLLREKLALDVPTFETDLFDTGIIDSLAFVELIVQLEETFGIVIPMEKLDIEEFRSISLIAQCVDRHKLTDHADNTPVC